MIKSSANTYKFEKVTDEYGWTEQVEGRFKIYKEQNIDIVATIVGGESDAASDFRRMEWKELSHNNDFGGVKIFNIDLDIIATSEQLP